MPVNQISKNIQGTKMSDTLILKCDPYIPINIKNVLLIKLDHIGDLILSLPAIRLLRRHFSDAKFVGLLSEWNKDIAELSSGFDEIISYNYFLKNRALPPESNDKKEIQLAEKLAKYQFDLAIDLRRQPETRKFLKISGAKIKAGYKTGTSDDSFLDIFLESFPDKPYIRTKMNETHASLQSIALANKIIEHFLPSNYFCLNLPSQEIDNVKKKLAESGINLSNRPLIGIHPGATHPAKQWGVNNFKNLLKAISANMKAQFAILGGPEDLEICMEIFNDSKDAQKTVLLAGVLSIREFLASAPFFDLIIGNDNGALHCANAVGIPTITIFGGRETSWEWSPFDPRSLCIFHEVACSPCHLDHRAKCPNKFKCIQNILVNDVLNAVKLFFSEKKSIISTNYFFVDFNQRKDEDIKFTLEKVNLLSKPKIIIAAWGIVANDAIGNDCIEEYRALKELGKDVYLYAEILDPIYRNKALQDIKILSNPNTILIYHHGNYWEKGYDLLKKFKGNLIVKYHNITPAYFFEPYSPQLALKHSKAIQQTKDLLNFYGLQLILCDSTYNEQDIKKYLSNSKKIEILPPFHKIHDLENLSINLNLIRKLLDKKINVLFTGRISPHKGLSHLLNVASYYKNSFNDAFRFIIVGGCDYNLNLYLYELKLLIEKMGLAKNVIFTGRVNNNDLKSFYLASHIFLIMSEHEGFCVPILESQYFKVPIIAYASTAIPETLGENQISFKNLEYEQYSKAIATIANNQEFKLFLTENGLRNFSKYDYKILRQKFLSTIGDFL